jgi:hypothetical protein
MHHRSSLFADRNVPRPHHEVLNCRFLSHLFVAPNFYETTIVFGTYVLSSYAHKYCV